MEAIAAPVGNRSEFDSVFAAQVHEPNGGLIVMRDSFLVAHRVEITSLDARYRLPVVYPYALFAEVGGLLISTTKIAALSALMTLALLRKRQRLLRRATILSMMGVGVKRVEIAVILLTRPVIISGRPALSAA